MVGFDDAAVVAIIMSLVRIATDPEFGLPKRYAPILAVVLGIAAGVFYLYPGDLKQGILSGIAMGLSAVGLHSGVKNVVRRDQQ